MFALGAPGPLRRNPGAGRTAAAAMPAAAAVLPGDLGRRTMLGDTGAHAPGAAVGAAIVEGTGRTGLLAHAAALVVAAVHGDAVSAAARTPARKRNRTLRHSSG